MTEYPLWWVRENLKASLELWNDQTDLYELPNMDPKQVTTSSSRVRPLLTWTPLRILAGVAPLPATQTTSAGIDRCANCLAAKAVKL